MAKQDPVVKAFRSDKGIRVQNPKPTYMGGGGGGGRYSLRTTGNLKSNNEQFEFVTQGFTKMSKAVKASKNYAKQWANQWNDKAVNIKHTKNK